MTGLRPPEPGCERATLSETISDGSPWGMEGAKSFYSVKSQAVNVSIPHPSTELCMVHHYNSRFYEKIIFKMKQKAVVNANR